MKPQDRQGLFEALVLALPNPVSELHYANPFELLVAVILSAQATDVSVNKVTPALFRLAPTPQKLVELGEDKVRELIKTIGLFNHKAKNLVLCAAQLLERHQGEVPRDRASLMALAGVGVKTAGEVLNVAFGEPCIPVDTHVFRVANRIGLAPGKTVLEVENKLLKVVPDEFKHNAHHWLILHGRYTCTARKPRCPECVIYDLCEYKAKVNT